MFLNVTKHTPKMANQFLFWLVGTWKYLVYWLWLDLSSSDTKGFALSNAQVEGLSTDSLCSGVFHSKGES